MWRAFRILVFLGFGVALALWLGNVGGTVEIKVGDAWIGTTFPFAVLLLTGTFLIVHAILSAFAALRRWPERRRARRGTLRRDQGDAALTRALVALAAGSAESARLEVRKARSLLGDTPQLLLLGAEAERLSGREDAAAEAFRALAGREDSRFLGLRGLFRQAIAREDWDAAKALAKEAEVAQPGAAWLREERAQLALRTEDWGEALALAKPGGPRAALSLAAAAKEADPVKATAFERHAFEIDRGFAPAALAYAGRLKATGSPRRGMTVLEEAWQAAPMPALAAAYLEGETDPLAKVKAVETLVQANPSHPESRLLLAQTLLEADLTGRARTELRALVREGGADRRAYLLLAELEEAEKGDTPEARAAQSGWLREAAGAVPAPEWRCGNCGTAQPEWSAVCPSCGTVGQIAWATPARVA